MVGICTALRPRVDWIRDLEQRMEKSMLNVLTVDVWNQVAEKANGHRMMVAVAFVTDLGKLKMKKGDVLICDASDKNVSAGVVDRDLLVKLNRRGVEIIHYPNLHAKCARFGRGMQYTLIGSSNLSQNSSETLEEVSVMTNDLGVGAKVDARIEEWIEAGFEVNKVFLERIMRLPRVKRFGGKRRKSAKRPEKKELGDRIWVVGSSPATFSKEEQLVLDGMKESAEANRERYRVAQHSELEELIWWGRYGFVKKVKRGDLIVKIFEKRVGVNIVLAVKRIREKVYCCHLPILGMRQRSFKDFNRALEISMRRPLYKEGTARLMLKMHIPLLKKLWSRIDWGE